MKQKNQFVNFASTKPESALELIFQTSIQNCSLATQMHNFKMVKLPLTNGAAVKSDSLTSDCNKLQVNRGKFKIFRLIKVQINVYKTKSILHPV